MMNETELRSLTEEIIPLTPSEPAPELLSLPAEIIQLVLSKLAPEELSRFPSVNRYLSKLARDSILWMKKFERHFPDEYQVLKQKTVPGQAVDWFSEFAQTYMQRYKSLSTHTKELLSLLKEQDLYGLKEKGKSLKIAHLIELFANGYHLLIKQSSQSIKDSCYQLAVLSQQPNSSQVSSSNTASVAIPEEGISILGWAIRFNQKKEVIEKLIQEGQLVDDNLYLMAISTGHLEAVVVLLDQPGFNCNGVEPIWALWLAVNNGDIEIVKALLARPEIDCNVVTLGFTPLFLAAQKGHIEIVKALLVQPGIDCNATFPNDGATPLFIAAYNGHTEVVDALLNHPEINYNVVRHDGATPLFAAVQYGHIKIIVALLAKPDLNYNAATLNGNTPLFMAALAGHSRVVELLLLKNEIELAQPVVNTSDELKQFALSQDSQTQRRMDLFLHAGLAAGMDPDFIVITPYQIACIVNQEKIIASLGAALNFLPTTNEFFIKLKDYVNKKTDASIAFFDEKTSCYTEEQEQAAHDLLFLYACFGSLSEAQIPSIAKQGILGELLENLLTDAIQADSQFSINDNN